LRTDRCVKKWLCTVHDPFILIKMPSTDLEAKDYSVDNSQFLPFYSFIHREQITIFSAKLTWKKLSRVFWWRQKKVWSDLQNDVGLKCGGRVTGWVCETKSPKTWPNQFFAKNECITCTIEKSSPKNLGYFWNFEKLSKVNNRPVFGNSPIWSPCSADDNNKKSKLENWDQHLTNALTCRYL
jgi:hypothetical protein